MQRTLTIPQYKDPVARAALIGCALALVYLAVVGAMPPAVAREQPTPQTIILVATPTPPPIEAAPVVVEVAAATPVPAAPVAAAPADDPPSSQLVQHADGSVSLPGSEAWTQPQPNAAAAADPQLEIERAAAEVYQQLPTAVAPSAKNQQPSYSRRPHTGR